MFEDIWRELEQAAGDGGGRVERRLASRPDTDVFLAVSKPANERILTISAPGTIDPAMLRALDARGFEVALSRVGDSTKVELRLTEPRFASLFSSLVEDLVRTVRAMEPSNASVDSVLGRLNRWQRFLESAGPEGLGGERARGLFGELWFLREHLVGTIAPSAACSAWTGPAETHQDFQLPQCAVEVKTTGTKQPQKLRITSERQLDDAGVALLFLFYLSVDARRGGGESLPALIDSLRAMFDDANCREEFEEKLFLAGYSDAHRAQYETDGYTRRDSAIFAVRPNFPRIVEHDLKPGVGDVHYSVGVGECHSFVVSPGEFRSVVMMGASA